MKVIKDSAVLIVRELFWSPLWTVSGRNGFHDGAAWVDLIGLANDFESELDVRGIRIPIHRGQVGWSQLKLAERWGWSRTKVKAFLKRLEKHGRITTEVDNDTTIITITNYCDYQDACLERLQEIARTRVELDPEENRENAAEMQQMSSRNALNKETNEQGIKKEEICAFPTYEQARAALTDAAEGYTADEVKEAWNHFEATKDPQGFWIKDHATVRDWRAAMRSRMLVGRRLRPAKNVAGEPTRERFWPPEWDSLDLESIKGIATGAAETGDGETLKKCQAWLAAHGQ
ncbi:MAG: hypothetical protein C5B50_00925 [Verrucomicrobia bacterium]|nr:MAG: hypothetical protein C5B50_00925 [Verrucomicrobiota bacterium]